MKKKTDIVINDNPPISIKTIITILPKIVKSVAIVTTLSPVTQVADVAVNNASTNPIDLPDCEAYGKAKHNVPIKIVPIFLRFILH